VSEFITYNSRAKLFRGLARRVAEQLVETLEQKGHAVLAVPGGTTPAPFFEILRKKQMDWASVVVLLTDERFLPETSERSNTRLLREHLLQDNAKAARLVPLYKPADAPEAVLDALRQGIAAVLPLDVCVLGMGTDMHTASLFPGADQLRAALAEDAPVLLPMRAKGAPEPRLTLTAPVLRGAEHLHILIAGKEKQTALANALHEGPVEDAPVRVVLNRPKGVIVHYAD